MMTRDEIIDHMNWHPSAEITLSDLVGRIERVVRAAEQKERNELLKLCRKSKGLDCDGLPARLSIYELEQELIFRS